MDLFAEKRILTVSQLTHLIREVLEENFCHVWLEGEVSNLAAPGSGHLYFTLKDAGAQIRCVLFRASARAVKFRLENGMRLVLRGRVSVYDQRGDYQFIAEYLEPKGTGALQLAFMQLKEKLAREGLFDESRKRSIPLLPRRVGVVTSSSGAAIHDILTVLKRRRAPVEVLILPVRVQGEGAALEIAEAIRDFNRYREVDVLIVGRGGGSIEDLWAFNEEVVARAIRGSRIPVISAVGHEVDFTIADFAADLRAPTPSAAAEMVVKSREELEGELRHLSSRLAAAMVRNLAAGRERSRGLIRALKDPSFLLGHLVQRVDDLSERLRRGGGAIIRVRVDRVDALSHRLRVRSPLLDTERCRERILAGTSALENAMRRLLDSLKERGAVNGGRLHALSPLATLERGYCIARRHPEGEIVRDSRILEPGDRLALTFRRGGAACLVESRYDDRTEPT